MISSKYFIRNKAHRILYATIYKKYILQYTVIAGIPKC